MALVRVDAFTIAQIFSSFNENQKKACMDLVSCLIISFLIMCESLFERILLCRF